MLRVTRAQTGAALVDVMAERLAVPLDGVFDAEQVVVHSLGMERWLSQQLAGRLGMRVGGDGICANVQFPFPIDIVRRGIMAAGGPNPSRSVWSPDRLVWPLLELLQDVTDLADPLAARLSAPGANRFDVVRGVADLFDRYSVHRPDMVVCWLDGQDVDPEGGALAAQKSWQPQLFRRLRAAVGQPCVAESVRDAVQALAGQAGLPSRISLFGFTALPTAHLGVLVALADHIDVDLYLLHPSPALWDRTSAALAAEVAPDRAADALLRMPLRENGPPAQANNRVLRSWGRHSTELQVMVHRIAGDIEVVSGDSATDTDDTRLARLQQRIALDSDVQGDLGAADDSLAVHACHGRTRQVQVLRDEILRLMAADPTLEPRDIIVMCPSVEEFAPLVNAHLRVPPDDPDGRPDLRVRLADRALRQTNSLMRVLDELLAVAGARLSITRLLDIVSSAPVRRRFGFSHDDVSTIADWARQAGIRWGIDHDDRTRFGVDIDDATVEAGMSRVLLGVAMADEDQRTLGGVTPLDAVEGSDVTVAGRLAEFVDRLGSVLKAFRAEQSLADWVAVLTRGTDLLLLADWDDPWERVQVTELLGDIADEADSGLDGRATVPLSVGDIRALLADRLRGKPSRANHRTGDLTVCTLVPMRSVPHRVVCLLGMDDEVFPRRAALPGDDLISAFPRIGDTDIRGEDRQLLLDAIMSAADAVVITYDAVDERTGRARPPCVPIAELVRVLGSEHVIRHPLHAYDTAAFDSERPGFDPQAYRAAVAMADADGAAPTRPTGSATEPALDVMVTQSVQVRHLVGFATDPVGHFFTHTVGAYVPSDPEPHEEQVPLSLMALDYWKVGQAMLDGAGWSDDEQASHILTHLRGTGLIPPAPLAERQVEKIRTIAGSINDLMESHDLPIAPQERFEIDVAIGSRTLHGVIDGIEGHRRVVRSFSKVKAKQMVSAWVNHLALHVAYPDTPWESWVVGRHETKKANYLSQPHAAVFAPLGATATQRCSTATTLLSDLIALHDEGLQQPLVAPCSSAAAYAIERVLRGNGPSDADDRAAERWDHSDFGYGFDADLPAHVLLFGDAVPYDVLRRDPARAEDTRFGRDPEPHRFGGLAVRLWEPLLTRCRAAA